MTPDGSGEPQGPDEARDRHDGLLPELVAHLRTKRTHLREQWSSRITDARLLSAMRLGFGGHVEQAVAR